MKKYPSHIAEAINEMTGEKVIVKTAPSNDKQKCERLLHEARILQQLQHPNIVKFIQSGVADNGDAYLMLERLSQQPFNMIIPHEQGLPFEVLAPYFDQLFSAVDYMHQQGIIHCDIKSANVLVAPVKVIDFGIAYDLKHPHLRTRTGTPGFVAPELILGDDTPDFRTDVYALGALLAFCLTGRRAYDGSTHNETLAKQLAYPPQTLDAGYLRQSPCLQKIVKKAMAREKHERFSCIAELWAELNKMI